MPIKKPGKRPFTPWLQNHKALKKGHGGRMKAADLLLTPLIDMFVILVVFLIMNFSSTGELPIAAGIKLPQAKVEKPIELAPAINITPEIIAIERFEVGRTQEVLAQENKNIPALTEKLQQLRNVEELTNPGQPFRGQIIINCDKDVDFEVVRKVMFAAADAGYTSINYAVLAGSAQ